ncbi:MFS general substrate transporter [Wallemia mellicola]|uniref:MFS general substrate transporter n=1 Tax=Wallemia mellicola TaxID=1708541 RepID=A0AB38N177_9BASI|nr:MFS general substrate transporter [Wallemia mellicola]TIC69118.1 MFS general substrate transporter [Wallemia mellicola]
MNTPGEKHLEEKHNVSNTAPSSASTVTFNSKNISKDNLSDVAVKEERTDGLQDQTNLLPRKQVIIVFFGVCSALFCSILDQTVVSTAIPSIGAYFQAADKSTAMPVHGRLSDLFGRKYALFGCLTFFFLGSLACAVSQTIEQLIIFRAIAGIGNGGIKTHVHVIISDIVPLKERGKYQGILTAWTCLANGIGPLLGGVFSETIGWRWCFWINLPLVGIALAVLQCLVPFKKVTGDWRAKMKRIDYAGSIIMFTSAVLILISLNWGGNKYAWDSAPVLVCLIIGLLLMGVFVLVENCKRIVNLPIIPMYLFRNVSVSASYICTFFGGMGYFGALFYLPQYLQVVHSYSGIVSGALMLALMVTQTIVSFLAGLVVSKTGHYISIIRTGFSIYAVGCGLYISLTYNSSLAKFIGYSIIAGIGAGNTFQTTLISVQAAVKRQDMAVATGGRNFLRMLGGVMSLAFCDTILRNTLQKGLSKMGQTDEIIAAITSNPIDIKNIVSEDQVIATLGMYCNGVHNIFAMLTATSGCAFLLSFLIKQYSLERDDEKQLKEEGKKFVEELERKRKKPKTSSIQKA